MTVVAPIDRLAAILRLDMPAAVNRSTSRILRIGNLAPGIGPLSLWKKGPTPLGFADHPTMLVHTPPRDPQVLGIARNTPLGIDRNGCSGSVGTGARDQSESLLGITRCAQFHNSNLWRCCGSARGASAAAQTHPGHRGVVARGKPPRGGAVL